MSDGLLKTALIIAQDGAPGLGLPKEPHSESRSGRWRAGGARTRPTRRGGPSSSSSTSMAIRARRVLFFDVLIYERALMRPRW